MGSQQKPWLNKPQRDQIMQGYLTKNSYDTNKETKAKMESNVSGGVAAVEVVAGADAAFRKVSPVRFLVFRRVDVVESAARALQRTESRRYRAIRKFCPTPKASFYVWVFTVNFFCTNTSC